MKRLGYNLRAALVLVLLMTVLLGGIYPLIVFGISQAVFTYRASGSIIERADKVHGSTLIGQQFVSAKYFWGRLSATTPPYNPAASAGSNFNPGNPKLLEAANQRIAALQKADPSNHSLIPVDLVTASASGLDPHISVSAMEYQMPRVARVRGMSEEDVKAIAAKATEHLLGGVVAEPYVNIVKLNLALDERIMSKTAKSH